MEAFFRENGIVFKELLAKRCQRHAYLRTDVELMLRAGSMAVSISLKMINFLPSFLPSLKILMCFFRFICSEHPTVADGMVRRKVCFHWSKNCCKWSSYIRVRNCSSFYVYELPKPPVCQLRYCGADRLEGNVEFFIIR